MEAFFLGGNTAGGYRGYMREEIARAGRAILLKGGPGTGKNSLIRRLAALAAERGMDCELWLCSGDPASADGVYIKDLDAVVADATAPHAVEASLPVIRDEICDLAAALSRQKLLAARGEIEDLFAVKKGCYDNAYVHLKSALRYYRKKEEVYLRYADPGAVRRLAAAHALRREPVPRGGGEGARKRFCAAVTADGVVRRDEFLAGRRVHLLKGGAPGVRMFARCFSELVGADILLLDPLTGEEIEGVVAGEDAYVAHAGAFGSGAETIDLTPLEGDAAGMCAFYDGREREEIARAVSALSAAREAHLAAEKFFVAAADFSVTRRIGDSLAASLFGGENM